MPLLVSSIQACAVPVVLLVFRLGNAQIDFELQRLPRPNLETSNKRNSWRGEEGGADRTYLTTIITAGGQPITLVDDGLRPWILRRVGKCFEKCKGDVKLIYQSRFKRGYLSCDQETWPTLEPQVRGTIRHRCRLVMKPQGTTRILVSIYFRHPLLPSQFDHQTINPR